MLGWGKGEGEDLLYCYQHHILRKAGGGQDEGRSGAGEGEKEARRRADVLLCRAQG